MSTAYVTYDSDPDPLFSYDSRTCGKNLTQINRATTPPSTFPYHAKGAHSPARLNAITAGVHALATKTTCASIPIRTDFFIPQSTSIPSFGALYTTACSVSSTYAGHFERIPHDAARYFEDASTSVERAARRGIAHVVEHDTDALQGARRFGFLSRCQTSHGKRFCVGDDDGHGVRIHKASRQSRHRLVSLCETEREYSTLDFNRL